MFHASVDCYSISNLGKNVNIPKRRMSENAKSSGSIFFQIHKSKTHNHLYIHSTIIFYLIFKIIFFNINQLLRNMIRQ